MRTLFIFILFYIVIVSSADICDILNDNAPSDNITAPCLDQLTRSCKNGSVLFRMYDSSSKYPNTGRFISTNRDLGNYDQCTMIDYEDSQGRISGKYCTFGVAVVNPLVTKSASQSKSLEKPNPHRPFETLLQLPDNRADEATPITSLLSVCIPDKCTPREVGKYFLPLDIPFVAYTDRECATSEKPDLEGGDIAWITVLSIIGLCVVLSTCYDTVLYYTKRETRHPVLLAFSFLTNGRKLFHISKKQGADVIECFNGLRFISMVWVLSGHGMAAWQSFPMTNQIAMDDLRSHWYNQYMLSAPISVDTFFFISGYLLAYGYVKSNLNAPVMKQVSQIPMMIIHRYLRITPAAGALFVTSITLFKYLGEGPLYNEVTNVLSGQCTDHPWEFFVYVQNYVNYQEICLNHTWYLSADMQMFVLAPLVLIPVAMFAHKRLKLVLVCMGVLSALTVIITIAVRFADESYRNDYDTHPRLVDYIFGMMLGTVMRLHKDKPFIFTKLQNLMIWTVVLIVSLAWNIYYSDIVHSYEHTKDTLFYALYRPLWSGALVWIVYSCHHGYGGFINWLLTRPIFQIGAKLSFSMYLLHAVVEAHWLGTQRSPLFFGAWPAFYVNAGHFIVTVMFSILWVLLFESPIVVLEKFIFGGGGGRKAKK